MTTLSIVAWPVRSRVLFPGVLACGVVAAAATFLSQHYGAPVMLFALILGMAMNFLSADGPCKPGIEFTARQVLRWGVDSLPAPEPRVAGNNPLTPADLLRGGSRPGTLPWDPSPKPGAL